MAKKNNLAIRLGVIMIGVVLTGFILGRGIATGNVVSIVLGGLFLTSDVLLFVWWLRDRNAPACSCAPRSTLTDAAPSDRASRWK